VIDEHLDAFLEMAQATVEDPCLWTNAPFREKLR
jgi:hypothetical protein